MSKGGGGSAPPSVDPAALATGQAQANIETAKQQANINNVRTNSPLAQSYFEQGPDGRWNLNQSLSPQTEPVFNNQTSLAQLLSGTAGSVASLAASPAQGGANIINSAYDKLGGQIPTGPIDTSDLWNYQAGGNVGPIQSKIDPSNLWGFQTGGHVGPLATSLSFDGLAQLPTSSTDFRDLVGKAQNAAYDTQAGYLDPQFSQKRSDLSQQLADQGISVGTDAYSRAQGDLGRQETMAYQQAKDAAVAAGNEEQARLFGENLSSRQQGVGEEATKSNFYNQTQQQYYNEGANNAQISNAARGQSLAELLAEGGFANQAEQQGYGQTAQNAQIGNQARQQAVNERALQWGQPLSALGQAAQIGEGILSGSSSQLPSLGSLADFAWAGNLPTFGGSPTTVSPANVIGAQTAANSANLNRFAAGNTLNNQAFNGLGSLGGALGLGNGGLGSALGLTGSDGLFSGLFGGGGAAASADTAAALSPFDFLPAFFGV